MSDVYTVKSVASYDEDDVFISRNIRFKDLPEFLKVCDLASSEYVTRIDLREEEEPTPSSPHCKFEVGSFVVFGPGDEIEPYPDFFSVTTEILRDNGDVDQIERTIYFLGEFLADGLTKDETLVHVEGRTYDHEEDRIVSDGDKYKFEEAQERDLERIL